MHGTITYPHISQALAHMQTYNGLVATFGPVSLIPCIIIIALLFATFNQALYTEGRKCNVMVSTMLAYMIITLCAAMFMLHMTARSSDIEARKANNMADSIYNQIVAGQPSVKNLMIDGNVHGIYTDIQNTGQPPMSLYIKLWHNQKIDILQTGPNTFSWSISGK